MSLLAGASQPPGFMPGLTVRVAGVSAETLAAAATRVVADLATYTAPATPSAILCNWGVNEAAGALPAEATWENNYYTILDAIHAKWPATKVYIMRPWMQGQDADCATLHGWIDTIVAARSTFAYVGPDEAVWLKGADDGATMTGDGVHYSAAGHIEAAAQWKTVLGY